MHVVGLFHLFGKSSSAIKASATCERKALSEGTDGARN